MALDESRDNDEIFKDRGITYLIDKVLLEEVKPVNVDFIESAAGSGFKLTSTLVAGGGCGGSCSSC
ncbi:MAG: Iron-binding protein IscA [Syntrophaceae bacterium PtaB.Bin095]|jgi:Fe-S cluster assembly iron-binding protein IscA|nr:MAG: Iron-binding protein IscA [Syntrophaceae bacterium PtaB.Bin095]